MTEQQFKNLLVSKIEALQGCKANILASDKDIVLAGDFDLPNILQSLVNEGKIVEVEYALPKLSFRIKSFYLPIGTKLQVRNCFFLDEDEKGEKG